jgi:hypothetical protein
LKYPNLKEITREENIAKQISNNNWHIYIYIYIKFGGTYYVSTCVQKRNNRNCWKKALSLSLG